MRKIGLLQLPVELRLEIYKHCFLLEPPVDHTIQDDTSWLTAPKHHALLQVCQVIRHETRPIYYANCKIEVYLARLYEGNEVIKDHHKLKTFRRLCQWLETYGSVAAASLAELKINAENSADILEFEFRHTIASAGNLEQLSTLRVIQELEQEKAYQFMAILLDLYNHKLGLRVYTADPREWSRWFVHADKMSVALKHLR